MWGRASAYVTVLILFKELLTLGTLDKKFSRRHFENFILFFQDIGLEISFQINVKKIDPGNKEHITD